jgi:predicted kinase
MSALPVFIVSGRVAVGKTTVSDALASALGINRTGFGDEVRARAAAAGRESTREVLQEIGEHLVATDPQGFCAAVLARGNYRLGAGLVIDGIRHVDVLELVRRMVAPDRLVHVHVDSSEQLRQDRLESRNRPGDVAILADVEKHSTERQVVDGLPQRADIIVNAADDLESIVARIRGIL